MSAQHDVIETRDKPARPGPPYRSGSLDKALSGFKAKGIRVLDFWREGREWVFKVMKEKNGQESRTTEPDSDAA